MVINDKKRIFLDYASITPVCSEAQKEFDMVSKKFWANPSSLHKEGEMANEVLSKARLEVAKHLHSKSEEVVFTSSGTESLNTVLQGVIQASRNKILKPHIIVSIVEHHSVLEPIKYLLKKDLIEVSYILPDINGVINPESVKREINPNTCLVAIQHANNEIGTLQPIRKIANVIEEKRKENNSEYPYLLTDCSQSFLYENVSLERLQADFLVIDSIKIYGPRGVSALVGRKDKRMDPIIFGGGQEFGLRSGTQNVPAIAGFAKAVETAVSKREKESKRLFVLRDYLIEKIKTEIPNAVLNGSLEYRLPNNVNFCFPGEDSEFLVIKLDTLGFAVSASSACNNLSSENNSYVVASLGREDCSASSLRFTFGRDTTKKDLDKLIKSLKKY